MSDEQIQALTVQLMKDEKLSYYDATVKLVNILENKARVQTGSIGVSLDEKNS